MWLGFVRKLSWRVPLHWTKEVEFGHFLRLISALVNARLEALSIEAGEAIEARQLLETSQQLSGLRLDVPDEQPVSQTRVDFEAPIINKKQRHPVGELVQSIDACLDATNTAGAFWNGGFDGESRLDKKDNEDSDEDNDKDHFSHSGEDCDVYYNEGGRYVYDDDNDDPFRAFEDELNKGK